MFSTNSIKKWANGNVIEGEKWNTGHISIS